MFIERERVTHGLQIADCSLFIADSRSDDGGDQEWVLADQEWVPLGPLCVWEGKAHTRVGISACLLGFSKRLLVIPTSLPACVACAGHLRERDDRGIKLDANHFCVASLAGHDLLVVGLVCLADTHIWPASDQTRASVQCLLD